MSTLVPNPALTPKPPPKPISAILIAKILYTGIVVLSFAVLIWTILCRQTDSYHAGLFHSEAHYVASRDLAPFHRLATGDFYPPPGIPDKLAIALPDPKYFIGAYVLNRISMGHPIEFDSLTTAPVIVAEPNKSLRLVPLSEQTQVLDWIDAGLAALIQTPKDKLSAKVLAIPCGSPNDRKTCAAIVQLDGSTEDDSDLTKWRLLPVELKLQQPHGAPLSQSTPDSMKQGAK